MQLEIKDLHPYLLSKVKVKYFGNLIGQVGGYMEGLSHNPVRILYNGQDNENIEAEMKSEILLNLEDIKLILFPLKDLRYYSNGIKFLGYRVDENNFLNLISDIERGLADYRLMKMCFDENIDVFGLIEKGLAVDINTLSVE